MPGMALDIAMSAKQQVLFLEQSVITARSSICRQQNIASVVLQVVQSLGFDVKQDFPIYADRMPTQLLAYLRLSRVQDSGEIAKVCLACRLGWVFHRIVRS